MSIPLLSSDVVSDTCHQACLYYKCMLNIKWSKLVRTCHSSLQSTLSCHRKPWYPIVKWRLRQKHSSSSPVCNDQVPTLISAEGVQSVLLYQYITISLPCKAWLLARGVFYSSRMVCSTVQVLWGHLRRMSRFRKWLHFETMRHFARWCLPARKPNDITVLPDDLGIIQSRW